MARIRDFLMNRLGVTESYKLPDELLKILLSSSCDSFLDEVLSLEGVDLKRDFLRDIFQEEQGDRKNLKQDYTPDTVSELATYSLSKMKDVKRVADICAGTGSLSIQVLNIFPDVFLRCEEWSERVVPFLLLNLMLRNCSAEVVNCNVLTRANIRTYKLIKQLDSKFSKLIVLEESVKEEIKESFDFVVMNPPYSVKWDPKEDERNKDFGVAPSQYADYQFILYGLYLLKPDGILSAIVPHGILFRGNKEGIIRKNLISQKLFRTVLGLPGNLFLNTSIPTAIIELSKSQQDNLLFINSSELFKKEGKINVLLPEHLTKIKEVLDSRVDSYRLSKLVDLAELEANDFNLNIPRYVDMSTPEESINFVETLRDLMSLNKEIKETEKNLLVMMNELTGFTYEEHEVIRLWNKQIGLVSKTSALMKEQSKGKFIQGELF